MSWNFGCSRSFKPHCLRRTFVLAWSFGASSHIAWEGLLHAESSSVTPLQICKVSLDWWHVSELESKLEKLDFHTLGWFSPLKVGFYCSSNTTTLCEQHPRSHHEEATDTNTACSKGRVWTGNQQHPVPWLCQLGQDIRAWLLYLIGWIYDRRRKSDILHWPSIPATYPKLRFG